MRMNDSSPKEIRSANDGGGVLRAIGWLGVVFLGIWTLWCAAYHACSIVTPGEVVAGGQALGGGQALEHIGPADTRQQPIALHALSIRFRDPDADEEVAVTAALPPLWPATAAALLPGA